MATTLAPDELEDRKGKIWFLWIIMSADFVRMSPSRVSFFFFNGADVTGICDLMLPHENKKKQRKQSLVHYVVKLSSEENKRQAMIHKKKKKITISVCSKAKPNGGRDSRLWLWWRRINEPAFRVCRPVLIYYIWPNNQLIAKSWLGKPAAFTYRQHWLMRSPSPAQKTETKSRNSSVDKRQGPSPLYNIGNSCYPVH